MKELNIVSTKVRNPQTGEFESILMGGTNGGGSGGTTDYNELSNKPKINGVTLTGNKTLNDIGITQAVAEAVAAIVAGAPADFDTLKEISDWIMSHAETAAEMNSQIQTNTTEISKKADASSLSAIATSGDFEDLENKPIGLSKISVSGDTLVITAIE